MTTPRDDIAGLVERMDHAAGLLLLNRSSEIELDTLHEASNQLYALSARVKEWEEHAGPYWEARATRAEQERDEAYERAANAAENPGFIEAQDTDWDLGVNFAKSFIAAAIRRLAYSKGSSGQWLNH